MKSTTFLLAMMLTLLYSCGISKMHKALQEIQNMPPASYDYIVQPEFVISKEASEAKLSEFYNAEEFRIGGSGRHSYDEETKEQINERYWLKAIVLNSNQVVDLRDEEVTRQLAKKIAGEVIAEITNAERYPSMQIVLMQQWDDGNIKTMKRSIYFTLPELAVMTP